MGDFPTYASVADVQARYDADMVDRICLNVATGLPDYAKLDLALGDASAEIDSYLTTKYAVPISPVPHLVMRMAADMAIYHAALSADRMTEEIGNRYVGWIKHLDKIARGTVGLGVRLDQTIPDGSGGTTTPTPPTTGTNIMSGMSGDTIRV